MPAIHIFSLSIFGGTGKDGPVKSGKFFLGNMSLGFALAEILKVPRLLENFPEYNVVNPHGPNAYDFYFQDHFEKLFKDLYNLKN